jgi:hypothetical protein
VSCTDALLKVATAAQLFHASDGTAFADLVIDGHRETWPLRSKRFGPGCASNICAEPSRAERSPQCAGGAGRVRWSAAQRLGPPRRQDGLIFLDLGDEFRRCIEIGPNGWRIAEGPPVRFRRSAGMLPLPFPVRADRLRRSRHF